ncbi:Ribonuclease P protein component [Clostridiaceae bacterium JG1575]|nr:Ribonuclease P protein component [Clostridiaceae bacterium JG1575]
MWPFSVMRKEETSVKYERLKKNQEFRNVYRRGRSCASDLLVLYKMKNPKNAKEGESFNRVGISVSKKVGKSVVRSRVKRLISEAARLSVDLVEPGYDLVFVARGPIVGRSFHDVQKSVHALYKKAGIKKA